MVPWCVSCRQIRAAATVTCEVTRAKANSGDGANRHEKEMKGPDWRYEQWERTTAPMSSQSPLSGVRLGTLHARPRVRVRPEPSGQHKYSPGAFVSDDLV